MKSKDLSNEKVIEINGKHVKYIQFKKLLQYPEIKHAYVIGLENNFSLAEPTKTKAIESYKKICKELGLEYNNIVKTNQAHTDNIEIVKGKVNKEEPDFNIYKETDGLITNKKGIILSTINADCILLILYDPVKKVIANVHSGWRGTLKRISVKAVEKMQKEYDCNPQDIICCMSPSIGKDHFEVDKDVYDLFQDEFSDLKEFENEIFEKLHNKDNINEKDEKYKIDTIKINREILKNAGLKEENIIDSGICSVCNHDVIHSYRAHGEKAGRATLIISKK